jgi:hypothetical protein
VRGPAADRPDGHALCTSRGPEAAREHDGCAYAVGKKGLGATVSLLAGRGWTVDIAEIEQVSRTVGVGLNHPANALRALRSLGVLGQVTDKGYVYRGIHRFDESGSLIATFEPENPPDVPFQIPMTRSDLHDILTEAAVKAGARIHLGLSWKSFGQHDDVVDVTLPTGPPGPTTSWSPPTGSAPRCAGISSETSSARGTPATRAGGWPCPAPRAHPQRVLERARGQGNGHPPEPGPDVPAGRRARRAGLDTRSEPHARSSSASASPASADSSAKSATPSASPARSTGLPCRKSCCPPPGTTAISS